MADKAEEKPEVPVADEDTEQDKNDEVEEDANAPEVVDEDSKAESGSEEGKDEKEAKENGSEKKENGSATNGDIEKCPVKRKSSGDDVTEEKPADGATPEKKAKMEEAPPAEAAESNGETDVPA